MLSIRSNSVNGQTLNRIKLFFEREEDLSALLFNHRNKIPGSETRTLSFGYANDEDGVEFEYVSPEDDALVTLRIPEDGSAVNPRKIESIGVRNNVQAHMHAWRAWMRSLYQRLSVEFKATMEADILIPGRRVLVADNIKGDVRDGQVESQQGLEVFASQALDMESTYVNEWGLIKPKPYYCFLQLADGTVQSMIVYKGNSFNSIILSEAPAVPLVMDDGAYTKTAFAIVEDQGCEAPMAFLVEEKEPADSLTVGLTCVNYDARYYAHDKDFISGEVRYTGA